MLDPCKISVHHALFIPKILAVSSQRLVCRIACYFPLINIAYTKFRIARKLKTKATLPKPLNFHTCQKCRVDTWCDQQEHTGYNYFLFLTCTWTWFEHSCAGAKGATGALHTTVGSLKLIKPCLHWSLELVKIGFDLWQENYKFIIIKQIECLGRDRL